MSNKKRIEENWEAIAKKRMWTIYPMGLYVLFGLFCLFAIFKFGEFCVTFFVGIIIECCFLPPFVFKFLQPKEMILQDKKHGKLKFVKWKKELEVYYTDIKTTYLNSYSGGSVLIIKTKDNRKITLWGIAKIDDVDILLSKIIHGC